MKQPSFDRRDFLKLTGAAALPCLPAWARAADDAAAALDAARAEGKATFFANITSVQPIMDAFHKATGIQGEYTRISSSKFIPTLLTEAAAGKLSADVVQAPLPMLELLKEQGILAPYRSSAARGYPDWATQDDHITLFGVEYVSYLYNTQHVQAADAPKTYQDLADPKWRGQIVMANPSSHASTISWLVGLKEQVFASEDEWMQFVKALAANKPMFVASFGPTPAPVESGEKRIAISMPKYIVTKAPAPLAWGPKSGPLLGSARAIAVTAQAPRPAAARALVDYWLSRQAMSLLARDVGEYVLAPGVYPPIPGIDEVRVKVVRDLPDDEMQRWGREFGKLFGAR